MKFNTKVYLGKPRHSTRVSRGIRKLWIWSGSEYAPPKFGKCFYCKRTCDGKTEYATFDELGDARAWINHARTPPKDVASTQVQDAGKTFSQIIDRFRRNRYGALRSGTVEQYEKIIGRYFKPILDVRMNAFSPKVVDAWIDYLKSDEAGFTARVTRESFDHELTMLKTILRHHAGYDDTFVMPFKDRHDDSIKVRKSAKESPKDLNEAEFRKFFAALLVGSRGELMARLAAIQFDHALRIGEAAGLPWTGVFFDDTDPTSSSLRISQKVKWTRKRGEQAVIEPSFKNSDNLGGVKEQTLTQRTFKILSEMKHDAESMSGLVFSDDGKPLEYRWIQHAYDDAFKRAGLPYKGTHVLRHGGCREVYNATGDLAIAAQILGNTTTQSVAIYAKRSTSALSNFRRSQWSKKA